jgi:hypothetical protein
MHQETPTINAVLIINSSFGVHEDGRCGSYFNRIGFYLGLHPQFETVPAFVQYACTHETSAAACACVLNEGLAKLTVRLRLFDTAAVIDVADDFIEYAGLDQIERVVACGNPAVEVAGFVSVIAYICFIGRDGDRMNGNENNQQQLLNEMRYGLLDELNGESPDCGRGLLFTL